MFESLFNWFRRDGANSVNFIFIIVLEYIFTLKNFSKLFFFLDQYIICLESVKNFYLLSIMLYVTSGNFRFGLWQFKKKLLTFVLANWIYIVRIMQLLNIKYALNNFIFQLYSILQLVSL